MKFTKFAGVLFIALSLIGCEGFLFKHQKDSGPRQPMDVSHIPEPQPRHELRTKAGNKSPYTVLGKTYYVVKKPEGYSRRGIASWYGRKFDGRKTANGEIYDMYGMTAAHKSLPIPSYVRVTNVKNKLSVIVRVNDRGPFHDNREIDLTYTAAKKLGFVEQGTAEVLVEYIDPSDYRASEPVSIVGGSKGEPKARTPKNVAGYEIPPNTYLQVGAFGKASAAEGLKNKLSALTQVPISIVSGQGLYKVHIGPFSDNLQLIVVREKLQDANYPSPHVVYR